MRTEILALCVACVSLVISAFAAYKAYWLSGYQLRVSHRVEYQKLLVEIDKMLINDPTLWAVYDSHPLAAQKTDHPVEKAKRDAFLQYHADVLEVVYVFFKEARFLTPAEEKVVKAWDNWARYLVWNSSDFRALLEKPESEELYNEDFVSYANSLLKEWSRNLPSQQKPVT